MSSGERPAVPADWLGFRELDQRAGTPKGEAFRAFRRLEGGWREGSDYLQLRAEDAPDAIAALRAAGRIYPASPHALLVAPPRCLELLALLARQSQVPAQGQQ